MSEKPKAKAKKPTRKRMSATGWRQDLGEGRFVALYQNKAEPDKYYARFGNPAFQTDIALLGDSIEALGNLHAKMTGRATMMRFALTLADGLASAVEGGAAGLKWAVVPEGDAEPEQSK